MPKILKLVASSNIITKPAHYIEGRTIEPIVVIEEYGLCHHLACVVKYISRAGRKTSALNDLFKANWYLDREFQRSKDDLNSENCLQIYSCVPLLSTKPNFSIQEIVDDWKMEAYLDTTLSYILAARLGTVRKGAYSRKNLNAYVSSLNKAKDYLQLAIAEIEEGEHS
jgi:hypothetical protein